MPSAKKSTTEEICFLDLYQKIFGNWTIYTLTPIFLFIVSLLCKRTTLASLQSFVV